MNHTCGAVYDFIPDFIETGLDILNPIQISAAKMDPQTIKDNFGDRLVFCGGTVDPQSTMDRGTAQEVYDQAIENLKILSKGGGMIAAHIHNIQATTRAENIKALFDAFNEFKIELEEIET
jgi:uroporphyrinogen-III decarboxylase